MFTSLLRTSAVIALIAAWGAESARRSTADQGDTPAPLDPRHSLFDISTVATAPPESLLGVEVVAEKICVTELSIDGFWVRRDDAGPRVFVVPAEGSLIKVRAGELVTLHGEVRLTTGLTAHHSDRRSNSSTSSGPMPYMYAYTVRPAWPNRNQLDATTQRKLCAP